MQWDLKPRHLFCKRTLNHLAKLAKWLSCFVSIDRYGTLTVCFDHVTYAVRVNLHSAIACNCLFRARSSLTFR